MKDIKLIIPNEWSDITIGTYQQYLEIQDSKKSEKQKIIQSLSLLCNTTPLVIKKMEYKDLVEIMEIIKQLLNTEPDKTEFKKTFTLDGEEYGFCPNLSKLTTGEYIDLETYCKEPTKSFHIIMSILYRKITKRVNHRYAIEPYNPDEFKEELFKDCPMDIALGSMGFFLTLGERLARTSANYLKAQETRLHKV